MKYPFIGEAKLTGAKVLFFTAGCGTVLDGETYEIGNYNERFSIPAFIDITHEHLKNTYGKVQSPEHAEFIIELAVNAGIDFDHSNGESSPRWFVFIDDELYFIGVDRFTSENRKKITIPLPPKADKQELSEWPQAGDEVEFPSGKGVLTVSKPDAQGVVIVESLDDEAGSVYKRVSLKAIKKPKSTHEELRDEIIDLAFNQFNDDSFDLTHNSYYLASDLIAKYNITKKV